jgi:hypothetical protein
MLKKAVKEKYEVFVNYFGDSQVKAEGPSTIMVEIYSNFSDNNSTTLLPERQDDRVFTESPALQAVIVVVSLP